MERYNTLGDHRDSCSLFTNKENKQTELTGLNKQQTTRNLQNKKKVPIAKSEEKVF